MSRNPKPTPEELRFVYDLLIKGYDEADVLAEYADLFDKGTLMFPYRTDKRFVRERKKELEASRGVLQGHLKAVDPIYARRKDEHFNHLADILRSIIPEKTITVEANGSEYVITGDNGKQTRAPHNKLVASVKSFLKDAAKQYGNTDIHEYLLPHLEAEIAETEGKELNAFIKENPLKFYKTLRYLADKRIFKGKCPVCRDW